MNKQQELTPMKRGEVFPLLISVLQNKNKFHPQRGIFKVPFVSLNTAHFTIYRENLCLVVLLLTILVIPSKNKDMSSYL